METLPTQNKPELNSTVTHDEAIDRLVPPSPQQQTVLPAKRQLFTDENLYIWGFRLVCFAIMACFLFVAAIYYGIINP